MHVLWKCPRLGRYEILALAFIILAIAIRLLLIANSWPETNSEEGTFGLEAMHIAYHGEFPIFMYGQNYMGVLEAYLGAILFHLFGVSLFTLRLGMVIFFALFLLGMYYLTKLLYSPQMALVTLAVLSVGSRGILLPEMMVLGGAVETLLFGTLLLLTAAHLSLSSRQERSTRKKWQRITGFFVWGCCAGLGIWSHLLIAPFVLASGLLLLLFCRWEVRSWVLLALLTGLVIGLLPVIAYNVRAAQGQDSISTFLSIYNIGSPSVSAPDPYFALKQLSGTFLYSLPFATGMKRTCDLSQIPFFSATSSPISCILVQGGWSLGYLMLLTFATTIAIRGLQKLRKLHCTSMINWPVRERQKGVLYAAQLMLLLSAAITLFLFAHSPNAASRPWSTRYLVGLLVATPALLWPLWNGISTRITECSQRTRRTHLTTLFRHALLALIVLLFVAEMLYATKEIPLNEASHMQDEAITHDLIRMGITHIYSGYWECDRFIFLVQEKIICSVINEDMSVGLTRYAPYYTIVHADPNAAYVFHQNSTYKRNFEKRIAHSHEQFEKIALDGYIVFRPENKFVTSEYSKH